MARVELWILRALLRGGIHRDMVRDSTFSWGILLRRFGVVAEDPEKDVPVKDALAALEKLLGKLENEPPGRRGVLFHNAAALGQMLGFTRAERDLLALIVLADADGPLNDCFDVYSSWTSSRLVRLLSVMIGRPVGAVSEALSGQGALLSTGLVSMMLEASPPFALIDNLSEILRREYAGEQDLLGRFFRPAPGAGLALDDFPHLDEQNRLLTAYLRQALAERTPGVNVLLHGPPGTGKTELARALAAALGTELFEVDGADRMGELAGRRERFAGYGLCQRFLARREQPALVLFDEVEDVFPSSGMSFGPRGGPVRGKAWVNRLLERNAVPAVWITNTVCRMDPAYLRRFDFVLGLRSPPRAVRRRIAEARLAGLSIAPEVLDRIVDSEQVLPADVDTLARVIAAVAGQPGIDAASVERAAMELLDQRLEVLGRRPVERVHASQGSRAHVS